MSTLATQLAISDQSINQSIIDVKEDALLASSFIADHVQLITKLEVNLSHAKLTNYSRCLQRYNKVRLLLVEDDPDLSRSLKIDFGRAGYAVDTAMDGQRGEFLGMTENYDIVVLDLGLPKLSGLEVLRLWRQADNNVPVIILTARDAWHEKVDGFKAGADDYLGKPFHIQELLVRIQSLLKRLHGQIKPGFIVCGVALNEDQQTVLIDGQQQIELTSIEFRLLRYLMLNPGKVLSKSKLSEHIYDHESDNDSNVIEVYINRLRIKIGKDLIATRRGQGYVFGVKA